jgi:hypothetical protein
VGSITIDAESTPNNTVSPRLFNVLKISANENFSIPSIMHDNAAKNENCIKPPDAEKNINANASMFHLTSPVFSNFLNAYRVKGNNAKGRFMEWYRLQNISGPAKTKPSVPTIDDVLEKSLILKYFQAPRTKIKNNIIVSNVYAHPVLIKK